MKVSIIIPHLEDGTNYLQDCLDSISARAVSVSLQVLVKKDLPGEPKGVAAMRNLGLSEADGDYILFMDSDDYLGIDALETAAAAAGNNPGCIIRLTTRRTSYKYATEAALEEERKRNAPGMAPDLTRTLQEESEESVQNAQSGHRDKPQPLHGSCLGQLIPRELVHDLRFNEAYRYYSDIPFMAALSERAAVITVPDAFYYKREHNDSVEHPALSQEVSAARFTEYDCSIREAMGYMKNAMTLAIAVCDYVSVRSANGKYPKAMSWSENDLRLFGGLIDDFGRDALTYYDGAGLKVLKALADRNISRARRVMRGHHNRVAIRDLLRSRHQRRLLIYNKLFLKLPIDRKLVAFSSFFGRSYCDSPRAIYEYMYRERPERRYVWFINTDIDIPGKCRRVKTDSLGYYYYLARAGVCVLNVRQPEWYVKRNGAFLMETWHGTPLKRLVFDLEDVYAAKPREYKKRFYRQALQWDGLVCDNEFSADAFATAFRYPRERMCLTGYPRNDILYAPDREERAAALKKKLGIPEGRKVVLYAPTWREDEIGEKGECGFTLMLDMELMRRLKDEYFFILRTHYLISDNLDPSQADPEYVADLSKYNDIAELYLISDVLITDYSSVFFDYANLRRPILFYVYDLEKYRDVLHGFYFDMVTGCPGPMLRTSEEILEVLQNIDAVSAEYLDKYNEFYERFCSLDDGGAAKRITDMLP